MKLERALSPVNIKVFAIESCLRMFCSLFSGQMLYGISNVIHSLFHVFIKQRLVFDMLVSNTFRSYCLFVWYPFWKIWAKQMCAPVQPKHILECSTFKSDRSLVCTYAVSCEVFAFGECMYVCAWVFIFNFYLFFFLLIFLLFWIAVCFSTTEGKKKSDFSLFVLSLNIEHRTFLLQSGWLVGRSQFVFTFCNIAFFMTFYGSTPAIVIGSSVYVNCN